ncbi:hypothetical protein Pcinc_016638 [Petrolisthes cinctipes]|uniref:Transposase n=1 Tax=Petrolisthes cinctipes TaxID=88211 RepID=A0AAE1KQW2_PETCI|nr:hypothetical protein Pcinc_016638 [Petrolisthes cinctipes]
MAAPTKDYSVELITQRGRIIGRWERGASTRDIADDVGVSQRKIQCSAETTRRRLRENSINCHVPACKEVLNDNHRETRLGFALQYLGEDVNFWNHVIFSDESYFTSVEVKARHCWRQKGTRYDAENIQERAVSGRVRRNYLGWMWAYGPGELVSLEGRFTAREYIRVLEDIMLPTVRPMAIPDPHPIMFVQDRSPIHTARIVNEWFGEHCYGRRVEIRYCTSR